MTSKGAGTMRKGTSLIGFIAAIVFVAGVAWAKVTPTPTVTPSIPFPMKAAKLTKLDFAHAMTQCDPTDPSAVTLHVRGSVAGGMRAMIGCEPGYADAVPGLRDWWAALTLSKPHGQMVFTGRKFASEQKVQLSLVLRPSREKMLLYESPCAGTVCSPIEVTFLDLNVVCPVWTANLKGAITEKTYLDQCLVRPFWMATPNQKQVDPLLGNPLPYGGLTDKTDKLDKLNLEIIDATLSDANGGTCAGGGEGVDGTSCADDNDCVGVSDTCDLEATPAPVCHGGVLGGHPCSVDADCPLAPGRCVYPVFGRAGIVR
jgi:hypothetical protein